MKQATIEYEIEAGGKRIAVLESIDIAGSEPMIVLAGVIIALSDRVSALEKQMGNTVRAHQQSTISNADLGVNTPPAMSAAEEQLEMDLQV